MTKQEFLNGEYFTIGQPTRKGQSTFKLEKTTNDQKGYIANQVRSEIDGTILTDDYHLNVVNITDKGFTGFTIVMDKEVVVEYLFSDLVVVDY